MRIVGSDILTVARLVRCPPEPLVVRVGRLGQAARVLPVAPVLEVVEEAPVENSTIANSSPKSLLSTDSLECHIRLMRILLCKSAKE